MGMPPRFRGQVVDTGSLLPLVVDFSEIRSVAANKLDAPGRQMSYQLVYELEALEGLGRALVEPLGGCGPNNRVGSLVVVDFLGTDSTPNYMLAEGFSISCTERPCFALDTEARMLPILEYVHTGLVD